MADPNNPHRRVRAVVRRAECGHASSMEFIWFVPILTALVGLIAYAAIARAAQIPVWAAARECARVASVSVDASRGMALGAQAAMGSLAGNHLQPERATVSIQHGGGRSAGVTCSIDYSVGLGGLPMSGWFGGGAFSVQASYTLLAEPYRSDF